MDPRNQPSLLERIYSWENLLDAYHEAASEKWYRNDVTAFAANLEEKPDQHTKRLDLAHLQSGPVPAVLRP